jgi:hypothetical protein
LNLASNPTFGIDPKKAMKEYLRAEKFDPKNWEYDDEEWQQVVQSMGQPPADSSVQVAELRAQIDQAKIESSERIAQAKIAAEAEIEQVRNQFKQAIEEFNGGLEKELAQMKFEGDKNIQFDALKVKLNDTVMKLATTKELAGVNATANQLPTPPVEPPGRAPVGQSYQR